MLLSFVSLIYANKRCPTKGFSVSKLLMSISFSLKLLTIFCHIMFKQTLLANSSACSSVALLLVLRYNCFMASYIGFSMGLDTCQWQSAHPCSCQSLRHPIILPQELLPHAIDLQFYLVTGHILNKGFLPLLMYGFLFGWTAEYRFLKQAAGLSSDLENQAPQHKVVCRKESQPH